MIGFPPSVGRSHQQHYGAALRGPPLVHARGPEVHVGKILHVGDVEREIGPGVHEASLVETADRRTAVPQVRITTGSGAVGWARRGVEYQGRNGDRLARFPVHIRAVLGSGSGCGGQGNQDKESRKKSAHLMAPVQVLCLVAMSLQGAPIQWIPAPMRALRSVDAVDQRRQMHAPGPYS